MLLIFCNVTVFCVTSNTVWKEAEFKQIKWDMKPLFDCCCYCCLLLLLLLLLGIRVPKSIIDSFFLTL